MMSSGSWHAGCPVAISDLRSVRLSYWDFAGHQQTGTLMVSADVAEDVVIVFRSFYDSHFPIHRMELIYAFGADDERSMQADNTSAFNCRAVAGTQTFSQHSYGTAIDINPIENPSVYNGVADPTVSQKYIDRTLTDQGMIISKSPVIQSFADIGWSWGGSWASPKDYMHFSLTGL